MEKNTLSKLTMKMAKEYIAKSSNGSIEFTPRQILYFRRQVFPDHDNSSVEFKNFVKILKKIFKDVKGENLKGYSFLKWTRRK